MDNLLTTDDLAEQLQIKPQTLANWRHNNKGPKVTKLEGAVRYKQSDVNFWIDENLIQDD